VHQHPGGDAADHRKHEQAQEQRFADGLGLVEPAGAGAVDGLRVGSGRQCLRLVGLGLCAEEPAAGLVGRQADRGVGQRVGDQGREGGHRQVGAQHQREQGGAGDLHHRDHEAEEHADARAQCHAAAVQVPQPGPAQQRAQPAQAGVGFQGLFGGKLGPEPVAHMRA
jgi:hypothetical protein